MDLPARISLSTFNIALSRPRLAAVSASYKDEDMTSVTDKLSRTLAFTGTSAALAWVMGLYFALLPKEVPWLPYFITSGYLEWMSLILALGAGIWCLRLLYKAVKLRGVAWWAYAIGILTVGITLLVMLVMVYGLVH